MTEGIPEVEHYAAEDARIGNVEGGPMVGAKKEVEKINDIAEAEAIDEITQNAGANEAKDNLHVGLFNLESFTVEVDGEESTEC